MPLETDISNLVASCDQLKESVLNKTKDIDAKVSNSIEVIESSFKHKMNFGFYINQSTGSDENNGNYSAPLKSIFEAAKRMLPGGSYIITLLDDYHLNPELENDYWSVNFPASQVTIRSLESEEQRKLVFYTHPRKLSWANGEYNISSRIDTSNGPTVYLNNLKIELNNENSNSEIETYSRFVLLSTNADSTPSPNLNMRFRKCDFTQMLEKLPEEGYFLEKTNNFATITFHSCIFPALTEEEKAKKLEMSQLMDKLVKDATEEDRLTTSIYTNIKLRAGHVQEA